MEWQDEGLILSVRKHGESAAIVSLLTPDRGRHLGLVRGGQSRRRQSLLQPGNLVSATWRARLPEHLGTLSLEPGRDFAAGVLDDSLRLKALASLTSLLESSLAEGDPQPAIYAESLEMVARLAGEVGGMDGGRDDGITAFPAWLAAYVRWELALLRGLGFGLDLSSCAATGSREGLIYVSPRSGRAVSETAGVPWRDRLLPLPAFLTTDEAIPQGQDEIAAGLRLTGHFLERHPFAAGNRRPPAARERLLAAIGN
ncbi:MAG: DNA repair protein RecO (recombination protein O) [Alphaproteobacteria bacterium]|jgi:DNA repair protein RecO (recombination protein O)